MIMASSHRQAQEIVLVESPGWKRGNIGYIDPTDPVKMKHGRQYYLIHWENTSYCATYVDSSYVHNMEDISKMKCTRYSPNEVRISPEQRVSLEGLQKYRALGRRLFNESSSRQQRIVEEDESFELSVDPFAEVPPEEPGQKRSPKPPLQEEGVRLEAAEKSACKALPIERLRLKQAQERLGKEDVQASKPLLKESKKSPTLQETSKLAGEKRSTRRLPQEGVVRLEAVEKSSRKAPPIERLRLKQAQERLGKEDVQASKPLPKQSKKSPTLQETSKQSSQRRRLITEEDDKMFSCKVDPFSEELVDRFEAQVENEAAESDQSSQENCF